MEQKNDGTPNKRKGSKMKKIILVVLAIFLNAGVAFADWNITVTWTPSAGPNLASEKLLLDGAEQCTVNAGDPATCSFTVVDLANQEVSVVSYNDQNTASAPYVVGSLLTAPAPASGGVILITPAP
jgi:hypothetical protein